MKRTYLWLDDVRNPNQYVWIAEYMPEYRKFEDEIVWVKDYLEFVNYITTNGLPDEIFFDHDLGDSEQATGYDAAKWLVNYCMDNDLDLPEWHVQSANPVGKGNINGILNNYKNFKEQKESPKEKALEIIHEFYYNLPNNGFLTEGVNSCESRYKEAIQCASITVRHMMDVYASALHSIGVDKETAEITKSPYLSAVKEEIEKVRLKRNGK